MLTSTLPAGLGEALGTIEIDIAVLNVLARAAHWPVILNEFLMDFDSGSDDRTPEDDALMARVRQQQADLRKTLNRAEVEARTANSDFNPVEFAMALQSVLRGEA